MAEKRTSRLINFLLLIISFISSVLKYVVNIWIGDINIFPVNKLCVIASIAIKLWDSKIRMLLEKLFSLSCAEFFCLLRKILKSLLLHQSARCKFFFLIVDQVKNPALLLILFSFGQTCAEKSVYFQVDISNSSQMLF